MATIIEQTTTLLRGAGAAGGVFFAVNTEQPPTYPFIVFQLLASPSNTTFDGPSDLQSSLIQVDILARSAAMAELLGVMVADLFAASDVPNAPQTKARGYEEAIKAFRVSQDFLAWTTT
jgi:hypothetical protein